MEGQPKTGMAMKGPSGTDLGDYRKGTFTPWLCHSLSPHSICNKSPNILAARISHLILSLKHAGGGCGPVLEWTVSGGNQA